MRNDGGQVQSGAALQSAFRMCKTCGGVGCVIGNNFSPEVQPNRTFAADSPDSPIFGEGFGKLSQLSSEGSMAAVEIQELGHGIRYDAD